MTVEEKIVDLLADGLDCEPDLRKALEAEGFDAGQLTEILGDLTEQDFAEITNLHGKNIAREGDRILDFTGLKIALTPAGIKRWMMESESQPC